MHERVREAPLSYLYPYSYGRSITAASGGVGKRQLRRAGIDAVLRVGGVGQAARSIGRNRSGQRVDQRLIEKKLRGGFGEHRAGRRERSNHNVTVDDASAVPAGQDGLEGDRPA